MFGGQIGTGPFFKDIGGNGIALTIFALTLIIFFNLEIVIVEIKLAKLPSQLEHVTPYIRQEGLFNVKHYEPEFDYSSLRWTVDEPEDFELVKMIFGELYIDNPEFSWKDVLIFLDKMPHLKTFNKQFERNEGFKTSLNVDQQFIKRDLEI